MFSCRNRGGLYTAKTVDALPQIAGDYCTCGTCPSKALLGVFGTRKYYKQLDESLSDLLCSHEIIPQDCCVAWPLQRAEVRAGLGQGGRGVRTAGTAPMLFICTGWFIGDAARGPSGAWGICTFPMDMGLN